MKYSIYSSILTSHGSVIIPINSNTNSHSDEEIKNKIDKNKNAYYWYTEKITKTWTYIQIKNTMVILQQINEM
jgi:hypothetical protein